MWVVNFVSYPKASNKWMSLYLHKHKRDRVDKSRKRVDKGDSLPSYFTLATGRKHGLISESALITTVTVCAISLY